MPGHTCSSPAWLKYLFDAVDACPVNWPGRLSLHLFPGGHFFLHTRTMPLSAMVARYLDPLALRAGLCKSGYPASDTCESILFHFHNPDGLRWTS